MISNLEDRPYTEVIAMLERLAKKNDLLLSTNLIDFADDVWLEATKDNRQSQSMGTRGNLSCKKVTYVVDLNVKL